MQSRNKLRLVAYGTILAMILAGQSCREGATAITEVTVLDTNLTHIVGFDITVEVFAAGSDSVLGVKEILELITVSQDTTLKLDITVRVDLPKPVHDTTFVTDTLRCYQRRGESWNYACVKEH